MSYNLSSKLAIIAGLVVHGCGATTPLIDNYRQPPAVADVPTVEAGQCGVPVPCGTPRIDDPCSTPNQNCATGNCGGVGNNCPMVCTTVGRNGCNQWQPAVVEGPLPPPEMLA